MPLKDMLLGNPIISKFHGQVRQIAQLCINIFLKAREKNN